MSTAFLVVAHLVRLGFLIFAGVALYLGLDPAHMWGSLIMGSLVGLEIERDRQYDQRSS